MRFVRPIAGMLLLTIGLPLLLVGGALWTVAERRDPGGAFGGTLERVDIPGHAVVVPDLDALLRRDAPFVRTGETRLRISAQTATDPAFLGLAPAAEVERYLATASYVHVERVNVTRGPLPVRLAPADPLSVGAAIGPPGEQGFWTRHGVGTLDLTAEDLTGRRLSLVVMRPDARAGVAVDVRAEVRPGWLDPTTWSLLVAGTLLVILGIAVAAWPVRPREIVFVVEPGQVPVLAARLGVPTLDGIGRPGSALPQRADPPATPSRPTAGVSFPVPTVLPARPVPPERLPPVWSAPGAVPAPPSSLAGGGWPTTLPPGARPTTLADLLAPPSGEDSGRAPAPAPAPPMPAPPMPAPPMPAPPMPAPPMPAPPMPGPPPPPTPTPQPTPGPPRPAPVPAEPVPAASLATPGPGSGPAAPGPATPDPAAPGPAALDPAVSGPAAPVLVEPVSVGTVPAGSAGVGPVRLLSLRPASPGSARSDEAGQPGGGRTVVNQPNWYKPLAGPRR